MSIRVVAVSGSRRDGSYTRQALDYVLERVIEAGAETDFIDLRTVDLPLYHPDLSVEERDDAPELLTRVRDADAVVLGSPVYHGSYSSTFKNFHDYCGFDEYEETVVGLVATAGGGSYGSTLEHMRSTVRGVHGIVLPRQVGIRSARNQFEDGVIVNDDIRDRLDTLADDVVDYTTRLQR